MFLLVYVDDIIVASSSSAVVAALLRDLKDDFALNDLGLLQYFLGIEVHHTSDGLHLSQAKYTTDILARASMLSCKGVTILLPINSKLSTLEGDPLGPDHATNIPKHGWCVTVPYTYTVGYLIFSEQSLPISSFTDQSSSHGHQNDSSAS
jgi:hypothetical protein